METAYSENRRQRWIVVMALVITGFMALLHVNAIYYAVGALAVDWIYDITVVLFALAATILALLIWRSARKGMVLKVIWGSLALGLLLWTIGEVIWAFDELIRGEELPYPSVADVVYVAGYIPLIVALYLRYHSLRAAPSRRWLLVTLGAFAILAALAVGFTIGPIVTYPEYDRPVEQFLDALYPLGDLLVALGALLVVLVLSGGALSLPWAVIAAGFVVQSIADLLFSYATWNEIYLSGTEAGINLVTALTDVPYYASYLIIAVGVYMQARMQRVA